MNSSSYFAEAKVNKALALNFLCSVLWALAIFFTYEWIAMVVCTKFFFASSFTIFTSVTKIGGLVFLCAFAFLVGIKRIEIKKVLSGDRDAIAHFLDPDISFSLSALVCAVLMPAAIVLVCIGAYLISSSDD